MEYAIVFQMQIPIKEMPHTRMKQNPKKPTRPSRRPKATMIDASSIKLGPSHHKLENSCKLFYTLGSCFQYTHQAVAPPKGHNDRGVLNQIRAAVGHAEIFEVKIAHAAGADIAHDDGLCARHRRRRLSLRKQISFIQTTVCNRIRSSHGVLDEGRAPPPAPTLRRMTAAEVAYALWQRKVVGRG